MVINTELMLVVNSPLKVSLIHRADGSILFEGTQEDWGRFLDILNQGLEAAKDEYMYEFGG
jgi:hypothetical protein